MGDPLGSLVRGSQKPTILCHWGWVVTNCIRAIAQPEMGESVHKPMRVARGTRWDANNGKIPCGSPF
jgi:hypothetical protein